MLFVSYSRRLGPGTAFCSTGFSSWKIGGCGKRVLSTANRCQRGQNSLPILPVLVKNSQPKSSLLYQKTISFFYKTQGYFSLKLTTESKSSLVVDCSIGVLLRPSPYGRWICSIGSIRLLEFPPALGHHPLIKGQGEGHRQSILELQRTLITYSRRCGRPRVIAWLSRRKRFRSVKQNPGLYRWFKA